LIVPGAAILAGEEFPADLACIACVHVLDGEPISLIVRDGDDDWQFLCGEDHDDVHARIVSLGEVLELDPGLAQLAAMAPGSKVCR